MNPINTELFSLYPTVRAHLHICIPPWVSFRFTSSTIVHVKCVQHWEKSWSTNRCQPQPSPLCISLPLVLPSSSLSCSTMLCCFCVFLIQAGTWLKAQATSLFCPTHSTVGLTALLWHGFVAGLPLQQVPYSEGWIQPVCAALLA